MKFHKAVFIGAIFLVIANAQVSKTDAVSKFRNSHPTVQWSDKSVVGNVLCDGKSATIILGSEKKKVVVGVISEAHPKKTQLLSFPIRSDTQDGFCAVPSHIELSALDCETDEGALPGCKAMKGCQAFSVIDDECDSFNFYWDSSRKSLAWWRH